MTFSAFKLKPTLIFSIVLAFVSAILIVIMIYDEGDAMGLFEGDFFEAYIGLCAGAAVLASSIYFEDITKNGRVYRFQRATTTDDLFLARSLEGLIIYLGATILPLPVGLWFMQGHAPVAWSHLIPYIAISLTLLPCLVTVPILLFTGNFENNFVLGRGTKKYLRPMFVSFLTRIFLAGGSVLLAFLSFAFIMESYNAISSLPFTLTNVVLGILVLKSAYRAPSDSRQSASGSISRGVIATLSAATVVIATLTTVAMLIEHFREDLHNKTWSVDQVYADSTVQTITENRSTWTRSNFNDEPSSLEIVNSIIENKQPLQFYPITNYNRHLERRLTSNSSTFKLLHHNYSGHRENRSVTSLYFSNSTGLLEYYRGAGGSRQHLVGYVGKNGFSESADGREPFSKFTDGDMRHRWGGSSDTPGIFATQNAIYKITGVQPDRLLEKLGDCKVLYQSEPDDAIQHFQIADPVMCLTSSGRMTASMIIVSDMFVSIVDGDGQIIWRCKNPDPKDQNALHLAAIFEDHAEGTLPRKVWLQTYDRQTTQSRFLIREYDQEGTLVKDFRSNGQYAESKIDIEGSPLVHAAWSPGALLTIRALFPFFMDFRSYPININGDVENKILKDEIVERAIPVILTISLLCALFLYIKTGRHELTQSQRWIWTVHGFIFGIAGCLAFLCLHGPLHRKHCPSCSRPRLISKVNCEHCGEMWPGPKSSPTDLFEVSI